MQDQTSLLATLHDGYLRGLTLDDEDQILFIDCTANDGVLLRVEVRGVVDMCATNFRNGNIIFSAEVIAEVSGLMDAEVAYLANTSREATIRNCAQRLAEDDRERKNRYFAIRSSFGCSLVAVHRGELVVREPATRQGL